jgi:hypothetical protein
MASFFWSQPLTFLRAASPPYPCSVPVTLWDCSLAPGSAGDFFLASHRDQHWHLTPARPVSIGPETFFWNFKTKKGLIFLKPLLIWWDIKLDTRGWVRLSLTQKWNDFSLLLQWQTESRHAWRWNSVDTWVLWALNLVKSYQDCFSFCYCFL